MLDRVARRDHSLMATKIGVKTKKMIHGTTTWLALVSPGMLPGAAMLAVVSQNAAGDGIEQYRGATTLVLPR